MTGSSRRAGSDGDRDGRLPVSLRRIATSPATLATFALLVVPFGLGWLETRLFSPLALPGYLIFTIGTAIGNAISPRLDFWVYWVPFLGGTAGIAVVAGFGYEWWCDRRDGARASDCKDDCSTATDGRSIVTVRVATNQSLYTQTGNHLP